MLHCPTVVVDATDMADTDTALYEGMTTLFYTLIWHEGGTGSLILGQYQGCALRRFSPHRVRGGSVQ